MTEVEKAFKAVKRIVQKKLEEKPNSGIIVDKGQADEVRISYKELLSVVESLEYHVVTRGGIKSSGICKDCNYLNKDGYTKNHGVCTFPASSRNLVTNYGKCMGIYDTCPHNSGVRNDWL